MSAIRRKAHDGFEPALQLDVVGFKETYLVLGEMVITLCSFASPSVIPKSKEPFNQIGIKRITFGVPDIADAARRVELHGGKVLEHTRYEHALATLVVVTDPDGIELELIQRVT